MGPSVKWMLVLCWPALAQEYDLVLRGGRVIDPANSVDRVMDVGVTGNRITAVAAHIADTQARKLVDVSGLIVVPGLVDLHAHVFGYEGSLTPDDTALPAGTTTIVDAGGSGWRTFDEFRRTVIAHSATRVLALLNIVGAGMVGEPYESNVDDMDPAATSAMILKNRDVIVGIKTAHFAKPGWAAIDRAVEAGRRASVPVMVDDKIFTNSERTTEEELLKHLRPGDIHTHMYNDRQMELIDRFTGKVQPWMIAARKRGVLFDVGHGGGSFFKSMSPSVVFKYYLRNALAAPYRRRCYPPIRTSLHPTRTVRPDNYKPRPDSSDPAAKRGDPLGLPNGNRASVDLASALIYRSGMRSAAKRNPGTDYFAMNPAVGAMLVGLLLDRTDRLALRLKNRSRYSFSL